MGLCQEEGIVLERHHVLGVILLLLLKWIGKCPLLDLLLHVTRVRPWDRLCRFLLLPLLLPSPLGSGGLSAGGCGLLPSPLGGGGCAGDVVNGKPPTRSILRWWHV